MQLQRPWLPVFSTFKGSLMLYCSKNSWKVHSLVESCETSREVTHRLCLEIRSKFHTKVRFYYWTQHTLDLSSLPYLWKTSSFWCNGKYEISSRDQHDYTSQILNKPLGESRTTCCQSVSITVTLFPLKMLQCFHINPSFSLSSSADEGTSFLTGCSWIKTDMIMMRRGVGCKAACTVQRGKKIKRWAQWRS